MLRSFFILLILLYASCQDIKTMEIPDWCFVCILILSQEPRPIVFFGVIFLYGLIAAICALLKKNIPMGFGDVKVLAAVGFVRGFEYLIYLFCFSSIVCGAYCLIRLIVTKNKKEFLKGDIPYMPFILCGFILTEILSLR